MKRKLLAMLLCTVILFNNALPALAEMDPVEGNTTETTTTAPEVTEPITPVVCNDCGQEKCVCEDETDTTASENTSESTATSEDVTTSESTSEEPSSSAAEETDEPCADCTDEAKCEKHADVITPCEVCNTIPCVCPATATCPKCGVEYTVVEGEEHACETTTCADCNATYITAVGHECPVVKCPTCNAVIEGEGHVCEEHICEVCQAKYYGETHKCEMCECGKLLGHEDACQICLCGAIDENTHAEDCMNIMMPKCEICEGAHTTEKCPENCQACLEVEGAEHTCGKIFCEICMEEMFEDIEHIHCEECEELLIEGECPICTACNCGAEDGEPHADFCPQFRANLGTAYVENTDAAPLLDPVEGEVARAWSTWGGRSIATFAAIPTAETDPVDNSGVVTSKKVEKTGDNLYKLTLEAYVTGATTTTTVTEDIPTDIVLVLDQSGSMASNFGTSYTNYTEYTNRTNGTYYGLSNLWYKDGDKYVAVSVEREWVQSDSEQQYTYTDASNYRNYDLYNSGDRLYYQTDSGEYIKVNIERSGNSNNRSYTYKLSDGTVLTTSNGWDTRPNIDGLYIRNNNNNNNYIRRYTYTYTKLDGTVVTFTSDGENTTATNNGETVTFWYGTGGTTISRSTALKNAVTTFVNSVNEKAKGEDKAYGGDDDVNHRIAVVGFASAGLSGSYYVNTELFIGATQHGYTSAADYYSTAFQSMDTEEGYNNVIASKNALAADGGTYIDLGIEMANGIFEENPIESGTRRNRVVVVFTDGAPGYNGNWNNSNYGSSGDAQAVANEALDNIYDTKNTYGATVYTVGIFSGADATTPMPTGASNSNKFMHYLSSNFKNAQSMSSPGTATYPTTGGYYLSAANSDSLTNIFQQISSQIQSGGASVTLNSSTVIKDVITPYFTLPAGADTSSIKVYTEDYTAENTFTNRQDATGVTVTIDGKTIETTGFDFSTNWVGTSTTDGTASYRGKKLVIEIPITAESQFLGGNNVPTNDGTSGVYSGDEVIENFDVPVANVTIPTITVDVVDKNVYYSNSLSGSEMTNGMSATANGNDLLDELDWQDDYVNISTTDPSTLTGLKADTTYSVTVSITPEDTENIEGNNMELATGKSGFDTANVYVYRPVLTIADSTIYLGEQPGADYAENTKTITKWMHGATEAANMIGTAPASFTYGFDTPISKFDDCKNVNGWITSIGGVDFTATAEEKAPFIVHVMTPTVKWADTERYYGETFPNSFTPVSTTWVCKDGKITATNGSTAPTINYTFSTTENGYMPNTTVPVTVTANIGDKTITPTYEWQKCNEDETKPETAQFLVHPLTCSLTITKSGWQTIDPNESFIFTLNGDNAAFPIKNLKVVVHSNGTVQVNGLPVGTYTATEDENWSWRYDFISANSVKLTDNTVETITATNNRVYDLWLDFAAWCKNVFKPGKTATGIIKSN